ncbi:MAG: bifunctional 2-polyprenyl-6-hydroxyphenol methylase/3-demethylubiquinol 3-O-methyltransferase UbiG [Azospirillaceae bacterium]
MAERRRPASPASDPGLYDGAADAWWERPPRWVRALANLVPARLAVFDPVIGDWRGKRVLDLGCAGGFMAEAIARRGAIVTGIDPAAATVAAARRHAEASGLAIRYDAGVGEALPYADDSFDVVVSVDVLEHVTDLEAVLDEVARVLVPGGLFCFDTINRTPFATLAVVTMGERVLRLLPRGTHDPALFIRPGELAAGLGARGFRLGPVTGLGPVGIDRHGTPRFGRVPTTAALYIGHAVAPGGKQGVGA